MTTITRNDTPDGRTYTTPVGDLPNVTGILSTVLAAPGLVPWAVDTAIDAVREHMDASVGETNEGNFFVSWGDVQLALTRGKDAPNKARDDAGDIGTALHDLAAAFLRGEEFDAPTGDLIWPWRNFLEWWYDAKEAGLIITTAEKMVYHPELRYAGTLDVLGWDRAGGAKIVIDFKTGNNTYYKDELQLAAYANCTMVQATRGQIVHIKKHEAPRSKGYKVIEVDMPRRWAAFQHVLEIYKDMKA